MRSEKNDEPFLTLHSRLLTARSALGPEERKPVAMMIVALVLFAAVILACLVAPSGKPAKAHKPVAVEAPQPAIQWGEARA